MTATHVGGQTEYLEQREVALEPFDLPEEQTVDEHGEKRGDGSEADEIAAFRRAVDAGAVEGDGPG